MNVLFLDVDGVLNGMITLERNGGMYDIDHDLAQKVVRLIRSVPNLVVVLSSSWRQGGENTRKRLAAHGIHYTHITPYLTKGGRHDIRGEEIKAWLDEHPEVTRYAILDDDSDMLPEQLPSFFKTQNKYGISDDIVDEVIRHFIKK